MYPHVLPTKIFCTGHKVSVSLQAGMSHVKGKGAGNTEGTWPP